MTAIIYFEEIALTLEQRGLILPTAYFDGHIEVDDDGDIQELWIRTRTHDEENIVRLDPCPRTEPFEYELAKRLRDEIAAKYSYVIDEYVGDIRANRRATAADHRNDQLRDQLWGV